MSKSIRVAASPSIPNRSWTRGTPTRWRRRRSWSTRWTPTPRRSRIQARVPLGCLGPRLGLHNQLAPTNWPGSDRGVARPIAPSLCLGFWCGWSTEGCQEAQCGGETDAGGKADAAPTGDVVPPEHRMVDRPPPRPDRGQTGHGQRDHEDVLVPLFRDEEAVFAMHDDPRHRHDPDDPRTGEWRQQSRCEHEAGTNLDERGDPC